MSKGFSTEVQTIIDKHKNDFNINNYSSKMTSYGGYDKYIPSLGGVFARNFGKTDKVTTIEEFQDRVDYVQGIMAIWGFDYYNGKTYWRWGQGSGSAAAADAFRKSGKGKCASGDIKKLATTTSIVTTNCNYGVDTLMKACGYNTWSCDYDKMIAKGYKKITDKSKLQVGDFVHFFRNSIKKANWRHIAIVYAIEGDKIWLADFGQRFIKNKKPLHAFPADYSTYGKNWLAVRYLNLKAGTSPVTVPTPAPTVTPVSPQNTSTTQTKPATKPAAAIYETPMPTIKQGSTGKAVKIWQIIVGGLKLDGKFGAKTATATKKWQKKHGLTVDGKVGPKTWAAGLKTVK